MCTKDITSIIVAVFLSAAILLGGNTRELNLLVAANIAYAKEGVKGDQICYYGLTGWRTYGYGDGGAYNSLPFEGSFGFKISTQGNMITIIPYSHSTIDSGTVCDLIIYKGNTKIADIGRIKINETATFKISENGNYLIAGTFKSNGCTVYGYLVSDGSSVKTARCGTVSESEIKNFSDFTRNWDPTREEFVSNENVTYPTSGTDGREVQVDEWEKHSDDIIRGTGEKNLSKEYKVFLFVKDLINNYAYDDYKADSLGGISRAAEAEDWYNEQMFMYYDHVGTCWDFVNAFSIMCRHHNIPCTSIEDGFHTWNAVYLNGGWVTIDITNMVKMHCATKDTSRKNWKKYSTSYMIENYGTYKTGPFYGLSIWNYSNMVRSAELFGSPTLGSY